MWHFAALRFADPIFFVICEFVICGFVIVRKIHTVSTYKDSIHYNALIQICTKQKSVLKKTTFRAVSKQSCAVFCGNFLSCDWRINHNPFADCDLRSNTLICGFAIAE
jgi:hypothetical protein